MNKNHLTAFYGWHNCPESLRSRVNDILSFYRRSFGGDLEGFYLHGSLAMGCFNPKSSDLDFLAVVRHKLTTEQKKAIIDYLLGISDIRAEMSIVTIDSVKNMEYPTPFELHYNYDHREQYENGTIDFTAQRCDDDMVLHFEVIRQRGICLYGKAIEELFPEIPREMSIASLNNELNWINDNFDTLPPTYIVLTPCRIIAFIREDKVMSKKEGGEWALVNLPADFSDTIVQVLAVYTGTEDIKPFNNDILHDILAYARKTTQLLASEIIK